MLSKPLTLDHDKLGLINKSGPCKSSAPCLTSCKMKWPVTSAAPPLDWGLKPRLSTSADPQASGLSWFGLNRNKSPLQKETQMHPLMGNQGSAISLPCSRALAPSSTDKLSGEKEFICRGPLGHQTPALLQGVGGQV